MDQAQSTLAGLTAVIVSQRWHWSVSDHVPLSEGRRHGLTNRGNVTRQKQRLSRPSEHKKPKQPKGRAERRAIEPSSTCIWQTSPGGTRSAESELRPSQSASRNARHISVTGSGTTKHFAARADTLRGHTNVVASFVEDGGRLARLARTAF
jgi:hypothetical protein